MSTEIAERSPQQDLISRLRSQQFQSEVSLALPGNVTPQRFCRVAITAAMQDDPKLNQAIAANPKSVYRSLLRCAADGLLPDGREAALVAYNVKGTPTAQYLPMIGGFRKIAGDAGWSLRTAVVYSGDVFEYEEGLDQRLVHRPAPLGQPKGEPVGAYAIGVGPNGEREFVVMDVAEIEKRRKVSRAKDDGPWVDWWDEMAQKTVGKALFKKLPLGEKDQERVARVVEASEVAPAEAAALLYPASQQAEAVDQPGETPDDPGTAAPVPGDDEPGPVAPDEKAAGPVLDEKTQGALAVVVPFGKWKGKTIGEIADADGGLDWFLWMVKANQPRRDEAHADHVVFLAALHVAAAKFPEILEAK